jgi:hypothetical protein
MTYTLRTLLILSFMIGPGLILAAAPREKPAAAPRQPTVTVTTKDGKTVRGTLESADPDHVTVKPSPKAEPVEISWDDITRVTNGLTREKVIEQYKKDHPDKLCKDCGGDGVAACATCHGTGFDPTQLTTCPECNGAGVTGECPRKCEDGKIDCPKPCLKLTQGVWKMKEGKRWRDFRGRDGTMSISEGHLGELIEMENGNPTNKGKCPTCGGTTQAACETCGGLSMMLCTKCEFLGKVGPPCGSCKNGGVECKTCGGSGIKKD